MLNTSVYATWYVYAPLTRGWLCYTALHGVEVVCEITEGKLIPIELGNYLWAVLGKEPSFRKYERHATKDTVFY